MPRNAMMAVMLALMTLTCLNSVAHSLNDRTHEHDHVQPEQDVREFVRRSLDDFRISGNDEVLERARATLAPALMKQPSAALLVDAAAVAQAQHRFDDALILIDRATSKQPGFARAWLLRAAILLVRGEPDAAARACRQLRGVPAVITMTCRARVQIARGANQTALRQMQGMLAALNRAHTNKPWLAWALSVAGDAAAPAQPDLAADYYAESLLLVDNAQVRAALLDLLIDAERWSDARDTLGSRRGSLALDVRRLIVGINTSEPGALDEEVHAADLRFRRWIGRSD
ncbi:MAG: hypothetical protein AAFU65_07720, partial [Pseudomonadota bacterium]